MPRGGQKSDHTLQYTQFKVTQYVQTYAYATEHSETIIFQYFKVVYNLEAPLEDEFPICLGPSKVKPLLGSCLASWGSLVGLEYKTSIFQTNTSTTNHLAQLDILAHCNARWHRVEVETGMALRARFQLPLFLVLVLRTPRALERRRSRGLVSRHCTNTTRTLSFSNCSQYLWNNQMADFDLIYRSKGVSPPKTYPPAIRWPI